MGTVHLLDLCAELIRRASRAGVSQSDVYPILLPDLAADRALISAIARHSGIPFLDASTWAGGELGAVEGSSSAAVVREIDSTFEAQNVKIESTSEGKVFANVGSTSAASLSPGMTNFLGSSRFSVMINSGRIALPFWPMTKRQWSSSTDGRSWSS